MVSLVYNPLFFTETVYKDEVVHNCATCQSTLTCPKCTGPGPSRSGEGEKPSAEGFASFVDELLEL